ncbi:MAG: hypothetical protein KDA52_18475, partial [Planctomycetaceae bacterium]|nr:hypothetical protein [Planctomycetaceae bacterium]
HLKTDPLKHSGGSPHKVIDLIFSAWTAAANLNIVLANGWVLVLHKLSCHLKTHFGQTPILSSRLSQSKGRQD